MKWTLIRNLAGPVLGAAGGFGIHKWITCRSGG
jgi:hypothetical protein